MIQSKYRSYKIQWYRLVYFTRPKLAYKAIKKNLTKSFRRQDDRCYYSKITNKEYD